MNASLMPAQEDDIPMEPSDGPGRRLGVARQARGLSQDQVASELRLGSFVIEALERDDYETLAGRVFVVGYIRKYARLVGLDPEPLLAAYEEATRQEATDGKRPVAAPAAADSRRRGDGYLMPGLLGVGVLILLGVLAFLWQREPGPQESGGPATDTTPEAAVTPGASSPATPSDPDSSPVPEPAPGFVSPLSGVPISPQPAGPTADAGQAETAAGADQAVPPVTAAQSAATEPGAGEPAAAQALEVVMTFEGPCWVQVHNREEKTPEVYGELKKGERRVLRGKPPYRITLGNAAVARITVGGEVIDLGKYSKGGSIARLTLDPNRTPMDSPR